MLQNLDNQILFTFILYWYNNKYYNIIFLNIKRPKPVTGTILKKFKRILHNTDETMHTK